MTNQVYFEINGTVKSVRDIPSQVLIVFLAKQEKKTKAGIRVTFKFYGITANAVEEFPIELGSCRMRAAMPSVVRDYMQAAAIQNQYWRKAYDKESN